MSQRQKKSVAKAVRESVTTSPTELTPQTAERLSRLAGQLAASPRPAMRRLIDLERRARFARCGFDAP